MFFPKTMIKNRYQTQSLLGRGGMGEVWKCYDESLNRHVVLKVVSPDLARSRPQHTAIFIDEARIGASLVGHPNVVTVFDVINEEHDGSPLLAIVMEYVEGLSCSEWIEYPVSNIDKTTKHYISLQLAIEVCKALQYAHRHRILHRDIKPLNIFISKYGVTKIGDFGISRYADAVTREHTVWNFRSPAYSAPEQWKNDRPNEDTDIYQLGCTLYQLLTGKLPFEAKSVAALIQKHLTETPQDPKAHNDLISSDLSKIIIASLSKNPAERPALWQVIDALAKEVQHKYEMKINFDKSDHRLIELVNGITEFDEDVLKSNGAFRTNFVDYNEAISESIELTLLGKVNVSLKKI